MIRYSDNYCIEEMQMRTKLFRSGDQRAVVIPADILALIGAADCASFEMTTPNGRDLLLSPVHAPTTVREPPPAVETTGACDDPKETLRAIAEAQTLGFTPDYFKA